MKRFVLVLIAVVLVVAVAASIPVYSLLASRWVTSAVFTRVKNSHYEEASAQLCDPDATPEAQRLMAWLQEQYGSYILSGQYVDPYMDYDQPQFKDAQGNVDIRLSNELGVLQEINGGKLPVVVGLDFTGVEYPEQWQDWVTQLALQWNELGGVVTFCWHWLVPSDINRDPAEWRRWGDDSWSTMNVKDTNFDLKAALADKSGVGYQWLMQSIDNVAAQLLVLQEAGVPVLWRPLHEAAGGWFWWGEDKDAYLELYRLLHDKLTNEYGLHNLIWLWNAQDNDWYPGDEYVDILADDPYPPGNKAWLHYVDSSRTVRFKYTHQANPAKMVAMSEDANLPSLNRMWRKNTKWLFFCTWDREVILKPDLDNPPYGLLREYLDDYNSEKLLRAVYNDPRVLTLEQSQWR